MANDIVPYNPIWYAQRAIERLEPLLTFAPRMFRAYEQEPRRRGDTIEVKKPGTFAAVAMPATTAQDIDPSKFNITLDQWYGIPMKLTDKELTFTGEEIIRDHIDPAMQAMARKIEDTCFGLVNDIPWFVAADNTNPENDFINGRKRMNLNNVPLEGRSYVMTTDREAKYLANSLFVQVQQSGTDQTQREGSLGRKFGFDNYVSTRTGTHTAGTIATTGTVALNGAVALDAVSVVIDATTLTGTLVAGDSFVIAGNAQRYAVTATATGAANNITVSITPPAVQAYADNAVVTLRAVTTTEEGIQLHREAFALVMAPLSEAGNGRGAEMGTAIERQTGITIRVTRWYEPKDAENWLRFDALWGVKTLDPNKAVRINV